MTVCNERSLIASIALEEIQDGQALKKTLFNEPTIAVHSGRNQSRTEDPRSLNDVQSNILGKKLNDKQATQPIEHERTTVSLCVIPDV